MPVGPHEGSDAMVYNRAATIERVHECTVRVRFQDNNQMAYIVHDHVEVEA